MSRDTDSWLDTAVSGIRFGPDQRAVRAELEGHLEDKLADLRRIFPDIPEEEARTRALNSMGDPEELRTQLARVHRAWLGYLWRLSWIFVLVGTILSLPGPLNNMPDDWFDPNRRRAEEYTLALAPDSREVRVDGYTISMVEARGEPAGAEGTVSGLSVRLRMAGPYFWALNGRGLCEHIEAEDSLGNRYVQFDMAREEPSYPFRCVLGDTGGRGPFHRDYDLKIFHVDPAAEWLRLEYDWLGRSFSMSVELKEGER